MSQIADRLRALRKTLGLSQEKFAKRIGVSRGYLSHLEAGIKIPSADFLSKIQLVEDASRATQIAEAAPIYGSRSQIAQSGGALIKLRKIRVYTSIQAGLATAYETLPEDWDDTIGYDGPDENAFALRIAGNSMEPNYRAGTIITLSPSKPAINGDLVAACIKNDGPLFKIFHHSGDGKIITLTSFNPAFPPITMGREKFHWIYKAVSATQKL